jgi:aryl-alcohol dehydrogenase-like predicted oxidoreductase
MKYRTPGRMEARVSVVGLGTWQFGGERGKDFTHAAAADLAMVASGTGGALGRYGHRQQAL